MVMIIGDCNLKLSSASSSFNDQVSSIETNFTFYDLQSSVDIDSAFFNLQSLVDTNWWLIWHFCNIKDNTKLDNCIQQLQGRDFTT